jgi:hypothetical protein
MIWYAIRLGDSKKSIAVHVYVIFIQTLLNLGSSYVPEGPAQVEFFASRNLVCIL